MKRQDFYYELPEELIAQDPLEDRQSSRLLVLDRESGAVSHHTFREITEYLGPGDCLVINDTKVIPARLIGEKEGTGARIESKARSQNQLRRRASYRGDPGDRRGRKPAGQIYL